MGNWGGGHQGQARSLNLKPKALENPILKSVLQSSKVELLPEGLDIRFLSHKVVSLQGLASILEPNLHRIDNGDYNPFIKCDCSDNVICHVTLL
ncbi:hypothetical protein ABKV19_027502 [Rosa sericea]